MMDPVKDGLENDVNHTNTQDHEPREERNNRSIKEASRVASHRAPCKTVPKGVIQELAELVAEQINVFPAKEGMLKHCSPNAIVNKQCLDFNKHFQHGFCERVQTHHQNTPTNTNIERTANAMCCRPNDNEQVGHGVMNLNTGKTITHVKVANAPVTNTQ